MYHNIKLFVKNWSLSTGVIIAVSIFPILIWGTEFMMEFLLAFLLSSINAFTGYFLVMRSAEMINKDFTINVYGGMLVRLIFIIGATLYLNYYELVAMVPFFISLMIFYVIHQWMEITIWMKELPKYKVKAQV